MKKFVAGLAIFAAAGTAFAGYTTVKTNGLNGGAAGAASNELGYDATNGLTILHILADVYDGSYTNYSLITGSVNGTLTLSNGVTARRVHDFQGVVTGVGTGQQLGAGAVAGGSDQHWFDGTVDATAVARFASREQAFGYKTGTGGGSPAFSNLSNVVGLVPLGFGATTDSSWSIGAGAFQWSRADTILGAGNEIFSGAVNNGGGGRDKMVTYVIDTGDGLRHYMLFFEDGVRGDGDYNDLAVELVTAYIPLPTGSALAGAGLIGLAAFRRRR